MQRFTGREYLYIDIANHYGLDKHTWSERIDWVKGHYDVLENHLAEAESPAEYYAAVQALREADKGNPIGYPIALDCTSSGIQIISLITGDRNAAKLCNVTNAGTRSDLYTSIYKEMLKATGDTENIKRADVKKAIMCSTYGSEATPKRVFGEGTRLLQAFYDVSNKEMPIVMEFMRLCLDIWNPNAIEYSWIMPDNFTVHTKVKGAIKERFHWLDEPMDLIRYVQKPEKKGRALGANCIHSIDSLIVREMTVRCMMDKSKVEAIKSWCLEDISSGSRESNKMVEILWNRYKESGFLSARIYDYLTKESMHLVDKKVILKDLNTFPKTRFNLICIHDSFKCLPKYGNDVREQFIVQMAKLHESNMLAYILSQITSKKVNFKIKNKFTKEILESEYALS